MIHEHVHSTHTERRRVVDPPIAKRASECNFKEGVARASIARLGSPTMQTDRALTIASSERESERAVEDL